MTWPNISFAAAFALATVAVASPARAELAETPLLEDWLFQAAGQPLDVRATAEVARARELVSRLLRDAPNLDLSVELRELARLEQRLKAERAVGNELYLAVRAVKRRIMLRNPAIDFSSLLLIDQPYPRQPSGMSWPYDKGAGQIARHENSHRNGMMATPGGKLVVLRGLRPDAERLEIGPAGDGSYWRPDLSFDGRQVLFCFKPREDKAFHLYEVAVDGSGLRQITFGNYDDLDPIYLPDGNLLFVSTRCHTYVRCMPHANSYVLTRCDADGKNIYILSHGNECEWLPSLLEDGRIVYSRWEYTDKPLWRVQSLWTVNPDGTGAAVLWGNQSVWPDHLAEPRAIPGTSRVMFTGLGHHQWFAGSVGSVDPRVGREFPHGLTKITADVAWPEVGNGPVDPVESQHYVAPGEFDAFKSPFPISEQDFLVSAKRKGDEKFRLYLMDVRGNCELLVEGRHNVWHAMPVRPRPRPPVQPDRVAWPGTGSQRRDPAPGTFYSADVYEGVPDLPRGMVKMIRVWQQEHTTFSTGGQTFRWSGPGISIVQEDAVKRILGTAPVHEDGSFYFEAPAGKMLYFQLLDEHGRALQTMRSFTGVMPGEHRGCVGCHEQHSTAPAVRRSLALSRPADSLTPPPWGRETIGYERFVQPVLDRYCGKCHQGGGEARKKLDLTLRPAYEFVNEPYLTLVGPAIWVEPKIADVPCPNPSAAGYGLAGIFPVEAFAAEDQLRPIKYHNIPPVRAEALVRKYATIPPLTALSYRSPLVERAISGKHHGVQVDTVSLQRLIAWVDAFGPYRGLEEVLSLPDPDFAGIEALPIRPRLENAPQIPRP